MPNTPKKIIWFGDYYGFGDNIYERPFVIKATRENDRVYLFTPFPEIYPNIPNLFFTKPITQLRAQKKNIDRIPASVWATPPPAPYTRKQFDYHRGRLQQNLNIIQGFEDSIGKINQLDFNMPAKPEWLTKAQAILKNINTEKKICIVKRPTLRREWLNISRNPKLEYIQLLIDTYKDEYFFISVADVNGTDEWLDGVLSGIDLDLNHGQTDIFTTAGLCALSDMVIGYPSYFLPLCISLKTKFFCIYGGSIKPELLTDPRMGTETYSFAAPDPFCNCIENDHQCKKDIPPGKVLKNFEELKNRKKNLLIVRMQPQNCHKIAQNKFISNYFNIYTLDSLKFEGQCEATKLYKDSFYYNKDNLENSIRDMDLVIIAQKLAPPSSEVEEICRHFGIKYLWCEAFFDNKLLFDYTGAQYTPSNEIVTYIDKAENSGEIDLPLRTREPQPESINTEDLFKKYNLSPSSKHIVIFGQTIFDMSLKYSLHHQIKTFQDYIHLIITNNPDVTFIYKDHPLYKTAFKDRTDTAFIKEYKNVVIVDENIRALFNSFNYFTSFSSTAIFEGLIHQKKFATCGHHFCNNPKVVLRLTDNLTHLYEQLQNFTIDEPTRLKYLRFICNYYAIDCASSQLFHKLTMRPEEYYTYNWRDYKWTP